jgi:two-component system sensor histidine kinase UhpB
MPVFLSRIIFCISFIFSCCTFNTSGSTSTSQQKLVDTSISEAEIIYKSDFKQAYTIAVDAKNRAVNINYLQGIVASSCLLSLIESQTNRSNTAIEALNKLLFTSNTINIKLKQQLLSTLGSCYFYIGKLDSAQYFINECIGSYSDHDTTRSFFESCLQLSEVFIKEGIPTKALDFYGKAYKIYQQNTSKEGEAWLNNVLGKIYYRQNLYEQSISTINTSISQYEKLNSLTGQISSLIQNGNSYYKLMLDDSAASCYQQALIYANILGDERNKSICYSNLSRIYLEHNKTKQALETALHALEMIKPGNYPEIEAGTYQQLGDIYGQLGQTKKAIESIQKALILAKNNNHKIIERDCYKSISELYASIKQYEPAMENLLQAYRIKDSIQPISFNNRLAEMEARYSLEKKESTIKLLNQQSLINKLRITEQKENIKKQNTLVIFLLILIATIIIAIYFYLRWRKQAELLNQQNTIRQTEENERMRIAKDIHDELGSGLTKIKFLSEILEMKTKDNQQIKETLQSITGTSHQLIDNMRDMIWNMNPMNSTLDNLVARVREFSTEYLDDFPVEVTYDFPENIPSEKINIKISRNILMIVKESLQNIVKHANATKISVRIEIQPVFKLVITENGIGFNLNEKTSGNGLRNMIERSKDIGATLKMTSTSGEGSMLSLEKNMNILL